MNARLEVVVVLSLFALIGCSGSTAPVPSDNVECANNASSQRAGEVSLSVNQTCLLTGSDATEFTLPAAAGPREYMLWVQSGFRTAGSTSQLTISTRQETGGGAATVTVTPRHPGFSRSEPSTDARWRGEQRLRQAMRDELAHRRARALTPDGRAGIRASGRAFTPPVVGETVRFLTAVQPDLTVDCDQGAEIDARVSAVGQRFAIAEDLRNPAAFTAGELAAALALLDDVVFRVDSLNFGETADLDGNERVWVLFTVAVNELSQSGGTTFVAGFFTPTDLADPLTCAATNEAEILYLVAPDPRGTAGPPISRSFALSNAASVGAHEFQHLISAQQRVVLGTGELFADLEDSWLSEGLAHTAETLVGFEFQGFDVGQNLGYVALAGDPSTFNAFHLENFRRAAQYLIRPADSPVLGAPGGGDPGGLQSIEMRGFSWLFVRWLADRFGPGADAQQALLRDLTQGGIAASSGISNVERAVDAAGGEGVWRELLYGFGGSLPLDDRPGAQFPLHRFTTFDLPDIFVGLHQSFNSGVFTRLSPLEVTELPAAGGEVQFALTASGSRFLRVASVGVAVPTTVRINSATGGGVSGVSRLQLGIARVR